MRYLGAAFLLAGLAGPAQACRLALLLALDVSSSVDAAEDALQRQGLAAALMAPEVQAAFLSAPEPVALSVFEWSGRYGQSTILNWSLIEAPADLAAASRVVAQAPRSRDDMPTAMGYALGHAAGILTRAPRCWQQTIDISGDGENNEGFPPSLAYRHFPLRDVSVNALVIGGDARLLSHFAQEVIKGPGAFVETARDYADFERAMRRKLEREVAARPIGQLR